MSSSAEKGDTNAATVSQPEVALRVHDGNDSRSEGNDEPNRPDDTKPKIHPGSKLKRPASARNVWEHLATCDEVLRRLGTHAEYGLTSEVACYRLQKHGMNQLTMTNMEPWWKHVARHLTDPLVILVQTCVLLCFSAFVIDRTNHTYLYMSLFFFTVIMLTAMLHLLHGQWSTQAMLEFRLRAIRTGGAVVVRDGRAPTPIDARDLVIGDVILLREGDTIPADVRILQSHNFAVNKGSLTGQSGSVTLVSDATSVADPLRATNLAFRGTTAMQGACSAVVIATGDNTLLATTAAMTLFSTDTKDALAQTPLKDNLGEICANVCAVAILIGTAFFVINLYFLHVNVTNNLTSTVGIVTSNVPVGVLVTITVSLMVSAQILRKRHEAVIKRLHTIATLGAITTVAMDKTGTLTQNNMNVAHISFGGNVHVVNKDWHPPDSSTVDEAENDPGVSEEDDGNQTRSDAHACFDALLKAMSVCSTATMSEDGSVLGGEASELAILQFTERFHDTMEYRKSQKMINMIPFDAYHRIMVTVTDERQNNQEDVDNEEAKLHVIMKGAPERVLDASDTVRTGKIVEGRITRTMSVSERQMWDSRVEYFGRRGEKVFGYAECYINSEMEVSKAIRQGDVRAIPTMTGMTFLGLVSLSDEVRDDASTAMAICKASGIRVWLTTGDGVATAVTTGRSTGIITKETQVIRETHGDVVRHIGNDITPVLEGRQLRSLDDEEWERLLQNNELVVARASPADKMRAIGRLRGAGETVGAVGDGGNDVGMMGLSDIGVALGRSTNEANCLATATVSDLYVNSDKLVGVTDGVTEGRRVWDNVKKGMVFSLSSNTSQLLLFMLALLLRMPTPMSAGMLLLCGTWTEVFGCVALAYEGPEPDVHTENWGSRKSGAGLSSRKRRSRGYLNRKGHMTKFILNTRVVSFACFQLAVMQALAGMIGYGVSFAKDGIRPKVLSGLDVSRGRFGAELGDEQRWLAVVMRRKDSTGFLTGGNVVKMSGYARSATWISKSDAHFAAYFSERPPGGFALKQEAFADLRPPGRAFENMVKVAVNELQRPPCTPYSCRLADTTSFTPISFNESSTPFTIAWNDLNCFTAANPGGVKLHGARTSRRQVRMHEMKTSERITKTEECVHFLTPRHQRDMLRRAQAAAVTGLIIVRMAALWTCRRRISSGFTSMSGDNWIVTGIAMLAMGSMAIGFSWTSADTRDWWWRWWWMWAIGITFAVVLIAYDEMRKALIRRHLRNESEMVIVKDSLKNRLAKWVYFLTAW